MSACFDTIHTRIGLKLAEKIHSCIPVRTKPTQKSSRERKKECFSNDAKEGCETMKQGKKNTQHIKEDKEVKCVY